MDNGLIFPYPCIRAHAESVVLTIQIPPRSTFGCRVGVMHGTLAGSRQAMGVTQEGSGGQSVVVLV